VGALIGAIASFAGTAYSNWISLQREREGRKEQSRTELERWHREQLQASLLDATSKLDLYIVTFLRHPHDLAGAQNDQELVTLNAEVKKWLVTVLLHYPNKGLPEYSELLQRTHRANWTAIMIEEHAWAIRQLLIDLAVRFESESIRAAGKPLLPARDDAQIEKQVAQAHGTE
jgi:hypothetical protein